MPFNGCVSPLPSSFGLASPLASASTALAAAGAPALRSAVRCAGTAPSRDHCGSGQGRRRSGRAPGSGWNLGMEQIWSLDETLGILEHLGGFE